MRNKEIFSRFKEKKLKKFFAYLEVNNDILAACKAINIDYFILSNWMKFDKELRKKVEEHCHTCPDEVSRIIKKRHCKSNICKTPEIVDSILEAFEQGIGIVNACEHIAGISYTIFSGWCRQDPVLKAKYEEIKEANIRKIESVFLHKLLKGRGSPFEYVFFLTNKLPFEYKNKQELTHDFSDNLVEKFKGMDVKQLCQYAEDLITSRISPN